MKKKIKLKGHLKNYMYWPLMLTILLACMNVPMYFVNEGAALLVSIYDAEITAPLGCGRFQQAVYILQQNVVGMVLLDDFINRPPENAFFALDALSTGAGNRVVLTGKATHQKVVRRHLVDYGGDICIHTVGILAKIFVVALISPLTSLAGFPLVCPNRFESFGTTL